MSDAPPLRSVFSNSDGQDWYAPVFLGPSTIATRGMDPETVRAVRGVLDGLSEDAYTAYMKRYLDEGMRRFGEQWRYLDIMTTLHAAASLIRPRRYLEIGVRRGRSMAMVAAVVPDVEAVGFDLWVEGYAGMENPGADFVRAEIARVSAKAELRLIDGNSHETVPRFFAELPEATFDLITVDGDHSDAGALQDLRDVLPRLSLGGAVVFDDIAHPAHPGLLAVWRKAVREDGGLEPYEFTELGYGVAFAVRTRTRTTGRRRPWLGGR